MMRKIYMTLEKQLSLVDYKQTVKIVDDVE